MNAANRPLLDGWMAGTASAQIFIYYQKPYKITESGEIEDDKNSGKQFYVTDGK